MIIKGTVKGLGCLPTLFIFAIIAVASYFIAAWLLPYSLNTGASFFGKSPVIVDAKGVTLCGLMGLVPGVSELIIPVAIVVWLVSLFFPV